ncbi:hypothetical protein H2203_005656 [Taxawa tesnikishii (nom. ined.)]|nr:hypothetical protein H2203_005656 [Dothideales sp. JES 119]
MRAIAWHKRLHQVAKRQRITRQRRTEQKEIEAAQDVVASEVDQNVARLNEHGGRRTLRNRRPRGIPAVPPIPDWFLKYNVKLCESSENKKASGERKRIWLVEKGTDNTLLSIPYDVEDKKILKAKQDEIQRMEDHAKRRKLHAAGVPTELQEAMRKEFEKALGAKDDKEDVKSAKPATFEPSSDPSIWLRVLVQALMEAAFSLARPDVGKTFSSTKTNLAIHFLDSNAHEEVDGFVEQMADLAGADIIRLDANDLAELGEDYVQHDDTPGSIATLAYETYRGFQATSLSDALSPDNAKAEDDPAMDDVEQDIGDMDGSGSPFGNIEDIKQLLEQNKDVLRNALGTGRVFGINLANTSDTATPQSTQPALRTGPKPTSWDEFKLSTLLDSLLDAPATKRTAYDREPAVKTFRSSFARYKLAKTNKPELKGLEIGLALTNAVKRSHIALEVRDTESYPDVSKEESVSRKNRGARTIVHLRDLHNLRMTRQGDAIVHRLARIVQQRRKEGEQIIIVGTTADSQYRPLDSSEEDEENFFTSVTAHHWAKSATHNFPDFLETSRSLANPLVTGGGYRRLQDINIRNIRNMIRRLRIPVVEEGFDDPVPPRLELVHIPLAVMLLEVTDRAIGPTIAPQAATTLPDFKPIERTDSSKKNRKQSVNKRSMEQVRKNCSKHESRLLSGVVDPDNIKTTFDDVHAPKETIEALKTLTTLSLLRPEAFQYGVLAKDRLPGLLLYGPPGTGKTLLAKAVAKESQATVLEVSGAQIYEKYVGEGEKMVNAVFSLAKKLSPCIVFIDEADAIFGSRGGAGNRTTHREIINQFLRGWDGMDDHSVFMMVATNRPFDLDDAVLRRLPRRLLVDLPVAKDRESILGIHLKDEQLDESVSLEKLAQQTPLYSGSDLKNLCVAAALTCVREENEQLAKDEDFRLPERRTLNSKHFDKALAEISASISEDMSSLGAIRKFDEQFGDRRSRKKKSGYGFGMRPETDESAARVRQDGPRP